MSEQKTKSNAPWILGLVGFGLSLPQVICSILCAAAAGGAASVSNEIANAGVEGADVATAAAGATSFVFMMPVICTFTCFILSFLGKSKISTVTGVLLILLGLFDVYACAVNLSWFGICAAVCFFCSGISSICNSKKVK